MKQAKNHRIVVARRGGPDVLQVVEEDLPEPQPGEVRVKVLAAGVSAYDLMVRSISFPGNPRVPFTPGEDIVGVVNKLGDGVSAVEPGDRVAGWTFGDSGGYTEYICRPTSQLVPVPWLAGLEMYGTASKHNHELVSALGAMPIDYRREDFVERIRNLTGDGVDAVFDPVGGARQLWRSYRVLRKGGRLVPLGSVATSKAGMKVIPLSLLTILLLKLIPDGRRAPLSPNMMKFPHTHNDWYRETLTELLNSAASGKIKPVVAERIPLLEAARAHALLERGGHAGKVVLIAGVEDP